MSTSQMMIDFDKTDVSPEEKSNFSKRSNAARISITFFYIFVWYVSALATVTTSKEIMNRIRLPFSLCATQFTISVMVTISIIIFSKSYRNMSIKSINSLSWYICPIAIGHTFGFILTNSAISLGS